MALDLGKTASITLITALPGSGKSLRLVQLIDQAIQAGELVHVVNIPGLKLPHLKFEDPRKWQELPAGSLLVVDEAQDFFPSRSGNSVRPDYIKELSRIRHHGVRMILATQQPDYLDSYVRGLVGSHEHMLREDGKESSMIWRHSELMENVRSAKGRSRYDSETYHFPKEYYGSYDSAQVHTVKRTIKSRHKRAMMFGVAVLALVAVAVVFVRRDIVASRALSDAPHASASRGLAGLTNAAASTGQAAPMTAAEYLDATRPRIEGLPGSAPIFDGRQVQAEPRIFCSAAGAGRDGSGKFKEADCHCITEQGTQYEMSGVMCEYIAKNGGIYDPYKKPVETRESAASMAKSEAPASTTASGTSTVIGWNPAQASPVGSGMVIPATTAEGAARVGGG